MQLKNDEDRGLPEPATNSSLFTLHSALLRGVAQLGDVSERSQCEIKRGIRSGSDLLTGKCNAARSLVTTGSALGKREII